MDRSKAHISHHREQLHLWPGSQEQKQEQQETANFNGQLEPVMSNCRVIPPKTSHCARFEGLPPQIVDFILVDYDSILVSWRLENIHRAQH